METVEFKHTLGSEAQSLVTKIVGTLTARSENLYGCNRYYIQPCVGLDMKVPEGWWVDEDDIQILGINVQRQVKNTGGPMSQIC